MHAISCVRHRFPPGVIGHAVWLYLRFTLSYRDIEDLLAARGLDVSYETVRRWVLKFGPAVAQKLRHARPKPDGRWHLDEMVVLINGQQMYLWRAVDSEGEVLDMLVQPRRDKAAAMKLLRKLLKRSALPPHLIVTDELRSYGAALRQLSKAHFPDQTADLPWYPWPTTPTARLPAPIQSKACAMPPDDGLRLDYRHSVQHRRKQAIEPDEEQSVRHRQPRLRGHALTQHT